jgi:tRNA pseudouridine38-40 synthase
LEYTFRAVVEYDGTELHGFQRQPHVRTVAGELEAALFRIFREPISVTGAGRTDAGVHAVAQVVSFTVRRAFQPEKLALALNGNIASDVSVRALTPVPEGFSARFDALERRYLYQVFHRPERSAVLRRFAHHDHRLLDTVALRRAARDFTGEHDFRAFCGVLPEDGNTVRTVYSVDVEEEEPFVRLRFRARGFLHRMVRVMTGTLLDIAAGKLPPDGVLRMLAGSARCPVGLTAPPEGLFFLGARYIDFDSNPRDLFHLLR